MSIWSSLPNMTSAEREKKKKAPLKEERFEWKTIHIQNPVRDAP